MQQTRLLLFLKIQKKDIIKFYGIDKSKIEVVYWATTLKLPSKEIKVDLPEKYMLFVGNRGKYKNFYGFFKAVIPLLNEDLKLNIVCAGSGKFTEDEMMMIEESGLVERVRHIRFKDDEELAFIYNKALCFVYPSLYEGFGSPILEAFSCECPIVLSNRSSFPEIGGDAVIMFNPEEEESIRSNIQKVISSEDLRKDMIQRGKERLKLFTYDKTIDSYIKVLKEVSK